jgi:hypothetical protein
MEGDVSLNISSAFTGCALAAAVLVSASTAAVAAPDPFDLVPLDQATIVDPDDVIWAIGGVLTADGTNLCATDPGSIAFADGTYPCFSHEGNIGIPGTTYPIDPPRLVPFNEATVVDPNTVTIVPGGVVTAEGTDLCTENPGSIVFPDGRYPCYINFVQTYGTHPTPEEGLYGLPQVAQLPVGGADTGVPAAGAMGTNTLTVPGAGLLGMGVLAAGAMLGLQSRHRR